MTFSAYREKLDAYRDQTIGALLSSVPTSGPPYLYDLARDYPSRAGKGLRGALCLATCRAWGGDADRALNAAVAVELFHNAFLLHDDVQDQSRYRRGGPTLLASHGAAIAINVGNATNLLALRKLMENRERLGARVSWLVMQEAERMLAQSVEGQAIELGWIHDNVCDLVERDYLLMCLKKTSWYSFIYPMRVGAIVALRRPVDPEHLCRFGWFLGAAFQIQDDLLNLEGQFESYGKEIDGDLVEGKRTLMLIHLLQRCTRRERREVEGLLKEPAEARSAQMVDRLRRLLEKYGSLDHARRCARQLAGAALAEGLAALRDAPDGEDKAFLLETALFVIGRDR